MATPEPIVLPKRAVPMVSFRDYRLSSLTGYCVTFKKGVPVNVPPHVYEEALAIGAEVVEGHEDKDPPAEDPTIAEASRKEAAKLAAGAKEEALKNALIKIITVNDPIDFKADGTPRANRVVAEMSPEFPRPTATEISEAYWALQSNIDLVED